MSVFIWTGIVSDICLERSVPDCDFVLTFKRSGRDQSVVYEIKKSNFDICQLQDLEPGIYQTRAVIIRCLTNASRIIYSGTVGFRMEQLVIEKCVIYWKDIQRLGVFSGSPYKELTLNDCEDEFSTGENFYFYYCLFRLKDGYNETPFFPGLQTVNVISSVARPLSGAFTTSTWPRIKELSIKG